MPSWDPRGTAASPHSSPLAGSAPKPSGGQVLRSDDTAADSPPSEWMECRATLLCQCPIQVLRQRPSHACNWQTLRVSSRYIISEGTPFSLPNDPYSVPYFLLYILSVSDNSQVPLYITFQESWRLLVDILSDIFSFHLGMDAQSYFIPGFGISRAIIQSDIRYYCGPDAIVRPYTLHVRRMFPHSLHAPLTDVLQGRDGFLVTTAGPAPTQAQIQDLKEASREYEDRIAERGGISAIPIAHKTTRRGS